MKNKRTLASRVKGKGALYLMLIPGIIVILIFMIWPMGGIVIAFKDFMPSKGIWGSPWVGLRYFEQLFMFGDTAQVFRNTLIIAVLKIIINFPIPIIVAIFLNEIRTIWFKKSVQTIIYLPYFISWVILGGILKNMLSMDGGMINNLVSMFGGDPIYFLGSNEWFRTVLIASDIWKNFGYSSIIFLAAIISIDPGLYEAAKIDGAGWLRSTWHVTIPGIMPMVVLTSILAIGGILNANFDQVLNLYNPLVYETGDIIDTFVYRMSLIDFNYSLGTALGLLKSVISLILLSGSYLLAYKFSDYRIF